MTRAAAIVAALLLVGCAGMRRPRPAAGPRPSQDTVEERLAAQRAADPLKRAEENEYRFGHEAARQRKQQMKRTPRPPGKADVVKSKNGQSPPPSN
jgi:hypothetical protein